MKRLATSFAILVILGCASAFAQEPLAAARELYAAAAYEDALDVLGKMRTSGAEIASTEGEVLRAFCLLALRRDEEARSVIEGVVMERPAYVPGDDEASPRVRNAFQEVRRKLLPTIARQLYVSAKDDYDKKNTVAAAAKFGELLEVLSDPDLAADSTLADLRLLAEGFREVSAAANVARSSDTQPLRSTPTSATPASAPANPDPGGTKSAPLQAVQTPVTPPVVISQQMPPWRGDVMNTRTEFTGAIDLLIDEQGHVESVSLRKSVHPLYDPLLLEAAKAWTYRPAMRGGQPIKFQKTLIVKLNAR